MRSSDAVSRASMKQKNGEINLAYEDAVLMRWRSTRRMIELAESAPADPVRPAML